MSIRIKPWPAVFSFDSSLRRARSESLYKISTGGGSENFRSLITVCRSCSARREAICPTAPFGSFDSRFIFVGRNPGKQEDRTGLSFYPTSIGGQVLSSYMGALGMKREQCYFTNLIFCHTTEDRPPEPGEINVCTLWKYVEFQLLKEAKFVFLLGNEALRAFSNGVLTSIMAVFGNVYRHYRGMNELYIVPLPHPGFLFRNPVWKKKVTDFLCELPDPLIKPNDLERKSKDGRKTMPELRRDSGQAGIPKAAESSYGEGS